MTKRFPMRDLLWERKILVGTVLFLTLLPIPLALSLNRQRYVATAQLALATPNAVIARGDLARIVSSAPVLTDVAARLRLRTSSDRIAALVRVRFDSGSGLTTIAARSNDEKRARAIADAFSDATVAAYRTLAQSRSESLIGRLERQSGDLRAKLRSYDAQIRSATRRDAQTASAQPTEDLSRIADLEGRRAVVVANLAAARAADSAPRGAPAAPAAQAVPAPAQAADPGDSYPGVVPVQETPLPTAVPIVRAPAPTHAATGLSEAALTRRIGTIDAELGALRARHSTVRRPSGNVNRLLSDRKKTVRALDESRRALSIANRNRAAALAALTVQGRSEFVERLIPPAVAAIVVIAAGAGLAIGAAYLAEAVDPRFRRSRHVEKLYGKPHIGSV